MVRHESVGTGWSAASSNRPASNHGLHEFFIALMMEPHITAPRDKRRFRFSLKAILALTAICAFVAVLSTPTLVWRYFPWIRGLHHTAVLNDATLIGASEDAVRTRLGEPSHNSGRYSWWWVEAHTSERSSLNFLLDENLNITRVTIPNHTVPEIFDDSPIPINLDTWKNEDDDTRHRMNLDLVNRWGNGDFPQLRTLDDVDRYFPKARYVHDWTYTTGIFLSVALSFDRDGKVIEVWEGND